ncbi:receptor-transporting protein 4 [Rhynchonycteris naso]
MKSKHQEKVILDVEKWKQIFQELIQEVKPRARWTLSLDETLQPDCVPQGWKQYQQKAFGRFQCSSCKRNWCSAQVQILCHMYLEHRKSQGQVLMRLFRQRCQKCYQSRFDKPEFSPESARRILNNLVWRIKDKYYGDGIKKFSEIPVIPEVPLEGSHDTANCEACSLGFCIQIIQNGRTTPSKSPFSSMEIGSSLPHIGDIHGQTQTRKQLVEAKKAQGSGCSSKHKRSGPSHAPAGTQVPAAGLQPKQETGLQPTPKAQQQAARGTESQTFKVVTTLPPGWTDLQPSRAVGPLFSGLKNSKSTLGTRSQAAQWICSQALRMADQQSKQEVGSRATQGTGLQATKAGQQSKRETGSRATQGACLQATKGTDTQPTCTATRRYGTSIGTQAVWKPQDRHASRGPAPDSFNRPFDSGPPNNSLGPDNFIVWGCACVAALWAFFVSRYFK